ncbi:hypothetical protein OQA88_13697, partial [Cercophora sp. LCS_1]
QQLLLLLDEDPAKIPFILKFLQGTPLLRAEIQDLIPLDELAIRVELIASIIKKLQEKFAMALDGINNFSFAALFVTPLHVLWRLNQDVAQHISLGELLDDPTPYTVKGVLHIFLAKNTNSKVVKGLLKSSEAEKGKRRRI